MRDENANAAISSMGLTRIMDLLEGAKAKGTTTEKLDEVIETLEVLIAYLQHQDSEARRAMSNLDMGNY